MHKWRRVRTFAASLYEHWFRLLSGSALIVIIGFFEHFSGVSVPWPVYAALTFLLLIYACFLPFADQFERAERLQADLEHVSLQASQGRANDHALKELQERYSEVNAELVSTRSSLTELQAVAGRFSPFSASERAVLVDILKGTPSDLRFDVTVSYSAFGGSAAPARAFAQAFIDAGWNAKTSPHGLLTSENRGIALAFNKRTFAKAREQGVMPKNAFTIFEILYRSGIKFGNGPLDSEMLADDTFLLIVSEN